MTLSSLLSGRRCCRSATRRVLREGVRLDADTTKNGEGRVFPFTDDLQAVLEAQGDLKANQREKGEITYEVDEGQ